MARIRSLLDSPTALERKDDTIRLLCHFLNPPLHERRSYRQRDLLQLIAKAGRPVAIQDIEKRFSLTRRMLQMDLKQLIESGWVDQPNLPFEKSGILVPEAVRLRSMHLVL